MRPLQSLLLILALAGLSPLPAAAHGPTPQKVEERIEIAAPPDKVWAVVKEFANIGEWHPLLEKSEGKGGNAAGAERAITFKSGGVLTEGLDDYNDKEMYYGYRLAKENVDVFPVSFYSATLTVKPAASGSEVEWIGRFYRADTGNFPPENRNDAAAIAAMKNFIGEGLKGLKAKVEGK
jgi:mxaD protein